MNTYAQITTQNKGRIYFTTNCKLFTNISEVKQTQIYDARRCTSNQEKNSQTKNKLHKQLVRSVGCRYGVQRVLLNLAIACADLWFLFFNLFFDNLD